MLSIFPNSASNNVGFVTSAIETNLALITASAPALRPIFRSRDRGGWFARSVMATGRTARDNTNFNNNNNTAIATKSPTDSNPDVEMAQKKPSPWDKETTPIMVSNSASVAASKFGRGGSRGGRKASTTHRFGPRGRSNNSNNNSNSSSSSKIKPTIIRIRTDNLPRVGTELRSSSPRPSEEQAMTNDGIVRVSDIQREIDGIVKDLAVAGEGSYTGGRAAAGGVGSSPQSRTGAGIAAGAFAASSMVVARPTTPKTPGGGGNKTPRTPKTPRTMAMARPRPSMETITVGATLVTPLPPRPSTSGSGVRRAAAPERYYSESIYPEQGFGGRDADEEYDEDDRVSRYLDRRFGVVTPRGTTPTSRGWEGSGRPF